MVYNVLMVRYLLKIKKEARKLRRHGKTYEEINQKLKMKIPKSTLSGWCHGVLLPIDYPEKIEKINQKNLSEARVLAWKTNKINRKIFLDQIKKESLPIAKTIKDNSVGLIALAMLCLGEASKYKSKHRQFSLGSSDPRIITIFLCLLKRFPGYKAEKIRCTVQCRADQDTEFLEEYWRGVTCIPKNLFYSTRIDPRTRGKPTKNKEYKGVLVIDYGDRIIQQKIESIADLVYNLLKLEGP